MDQHAIPQQISSYEFKLVGEMTLKQFLKLAVGLILAFVIYSSKLFFIIKWPLVFIFASSGVALAFIPFQDRPLDIWVKAFIKSIYSPTIYVYKKKAVENWLDVDPNFKVTSDDDLYEATPNYQKHNNGLRKFVKMPTLGNQNNNDGIQINEAVKKEEVKVEFETEANKEVKNILPKVEVKVEEKIDDWRLKQANLNLETKKETATGTATFGSIPMPSVSSIPNVVVGMITDKSGKLMEGVIVEIQDEKGNPARVLKTNPLGQFKTTTPLSNGNYLIIPEKDGLSFDKISIALNGSVVQPLRMMPL